MPDRAVGGLHHRYARIRFRKRQGERAVARAAEQFGTMFGRLLPFRRLVDFQHRREISLAQLGRLGLELMLKLS
jgi:hypothetical protein